MDVLTKASITIQIIEDVAIYKAQIFSSNGNIFGTTDKTSDISLVVWKGLTDITDRFDDIVWRRFTVSEENYEEDLAWGEEHRNKKTFVLTKEDINKQAKIQVEVYGRINGERQLAAIDYVSFIDVNDLQGSTTPPTNPSHGDIWLDTSVIPPRLMMWDNDLKMWVEVTVAGKDRRNLIRNSNFYKATFDHWIKVGSPTLEIESLNAKKWARLKSSAINSHCGIKQTCSAAAKSNYSFQILSQVYNHSVSPEGNLLVSFYSINEENVRTLIKENVFDITNTAKVYTDTFVTLQDTKQIETIISGNKNEAFDFILTNIKLENYSVPTEWELAIEDIQDALDNKVGNTHEEIFDSLTDNGQMQGIYVDIDDQGRKNFYFNATYIKSGKLLGEYIEAKNLRVQKNNGNITLDIDSEGNVDIRARTLQVIVDNSEDQYGDVASVEDIAWKVDIVSTNGIIFKNNIIDTTLQAIVYKGKDDVTLEIEASKFKWLRTSNNPEADLEWNNTKGKGVKSIKLTKDDVYQKATFSCQIWT